MSNTELLGAVLAADIRDYGINSPRSKQSRDGILGPSDLGFCRQKAALTIKGVADTDEQSIAAAQIGTAVHEYVAKAFKARHPEWVVEDTKVTATFPSGAAIAGTPDIIAPDWNAIIDVKTVDGFAWVKREGTSQNHKYQRHAYALGAIQAGILDDSATVYVCNLYIDRSGKEPEPYFVAEEFDPTLTDEIDSWIQDVIYAVKQGEDAQRDIPAPVCERICSKFTACRGELETHQGGEFIEDPTLISAIGMYVEGRDMTKTGDQLKKEAQSRLFGVNGRTEDYQVRWVDVAPTTVDSFEKAGYSRMDVRKVRK
jgi:hypothetical protein